MAVKEVLVISHFGCPDGFASAYIARRALKEKFFEPRIHFAKYNEKLPNIPNGAILYLLDFSYSKSIVAKAMGGGGHRLASGFENSVLLL